MDETQTAATIDRRRFRKRDIFVTVASLVITLALCAAFIIYWNDISQAQNYGYLGVFIINIFAGAVVVVPVPGILVVFALGSKLNPVLVGAAAGLGEAIGGLTIYLAGYGGHRAIKTINHPITAKFEDWIRRRGSLAIFLMSSVINPLYYPFIAVAGMMHFGLQKFFYISWAGKTVKGICIAYLGYFGLGSLLNWIGIGV
jgi:membrane protein DedA with SNARE-associated domain